jgi:hypothetical protein
MWFWRRGFGPGPSGGTGDTAPKGCAGPASRKVKKAAQAIHTPVA